MRRRALLPAAVALAFASFVFYSLARVEPLKVVNSRLERRDGRILVAGTLRNTGPDLRALGLEVRYYDGRGSELGKDEVQVTGLHHGAAVNFRTPPRELDGVSNFSLRLERDRNPYGN